MDMPWLNGAMLHLPLRRQGYTGTFVQNAMNHIQRAVTYVTPRNIDATVSGRITSDRLPVHPYRKAYMAGAKTHDVQHKLDSGAIPAGGSTTISRLAFSGAVSSNVQPPSNIIQSLAWAQSNPSVSAIAQNLGHSLSPGQRSMSVGFAKTGMVTRGK